MPFEVVMPQLGESVVEGTVTRWLKQVGDTINEYDPLLEVSTDKVDTEIPAPATGVLLKVYVSEGSTVEHGALLAVIGQVGEVVPEGDTPTVREEIQDALNNSLPEAVETVAVANGASNGNGYAGHVTPVVARMAAEHGLNLSAIEGTGRGGRITKKDVENYLASGKAAPVAEEDLPPWERPGTGDLFKPSVDYDDVTSPAPATKPAPTKTPPPGAPKRLHPAEAIPQGTPGELVGMTPMRKAIAEHMVRSKLETSPHVTTVFEVDMSAPVGHRQAHKDEFAKHGINLTLTAYFIAAAVRGLRENPYINSQWTDQGIYLHHAMHIGMAVALDEGLIVPVIRSAQDLNLMGLARAINDLATRARSKQLKPDEVQGGTFTITNHGVSGSLFATPIISQPQVAIMGVGVVEKRVKVINDAIAIRPCVYVSLTFDHRVIDGAAGDGFLLTLKSTLENWT